ncbi:unnamed protein product [Nezara viridula]|uniref:Uncharacterized protein n=1 Tax=Nezara viridula TaxID=85310 RepID=A0A9P0E344_NEZVI|nr:unnamed protein product [Nezara viridula]
MPVQSCPVTVDPVHNKPHLTSAPVTVQPPSPCPNLFDNCFRESTLVFGLPAARACGKRSNGSRSLGDDSSSRTDISRYWLLVTPVGEFSFLSYLQMVGTEFQTAFLSKESSPAMNGTVAEEDQGCHVLRVSFTLSLDESSMVQGATTEKRVLSVK